MLAPPTPPPPIRYKLGDTFEGTGFYLVYGEIISSKAIKRISPRINSHIGIVIKVSRVYKSLNFTMMAFCSHLQLQHTRADDGIL